MALYVDQVTTTLGIGRPPEVIETNLIQGGCRGIGCNVATIFGAPSIGLHNHGHRIPAQIGLDPPLDGAITGILGLQPERNRVQVGGIGTKRQIGTGAPCVIDHVVEEELRTLRAMYTQHGINRLDPFMSLLWIEIIGLDTLVD